MICYQIVQRPEIVEWVSEGGGELVNDPLYHQIVQRPEIAEWVNEGGGEVVNDPLIYNAHFTIECHGGFRSPGTTQTMYVSSHWVRSCLKVLFFTAFICYLPVGTFILVYSVSNCHTIIQLNLLCLH